MMCSFFKSLSHRKQVLATKAEAERDGVKVPTTLAEYCVRTRAPAPDEGSDLFYDYYYDDDDVEDGDGDCCYDEDDSGNEESWRAFWQDNPISLTCATCYFCLGGQKFLVDHQERFEASHS